MQADSLPVEPHGKSKNTGMGSLSLLQRIFPTQGSNLGLPHCRQTLYRLSYQGSRRWRRPWYESWVRKIRWRRIRLPTPIFLGSPCGSAGKEFACNAGDLGLIPGLGRSPGEGKGKGYPLQYSGLENSMDLYSPWGCKESEMTEQLSHTGYILGPYN